MIARHRAVLVAAPSPATVLFHSVATPAARRQPWGQRHQASSARQEKRQHDEQQNHSPSVYFQQKRTFARGRKRIKTDYFEKYSFEDIGEKKARDNKNILIIGSSGVLGKTLVSHLGSTCDWNVIGADIQEASDEKGLRDFIQLPAEASMAEMTGGLYRGLLNLHGGKMNENKLDAIVCASGSWEGDVDMRNLVKENTPDSEDVEIDIEEEYARESTKVEEMMRANFYPVVAGSQVGRRFMKRGGLFCTIGASAALSPTPGMLGYGSAKSAAHHYIQSWGLTSVEENSIKAVGILPLMLETPANQAMLGIDNADGGNDRYNKMVKPIHIANEIAEWLKQPHLIPHTGSLVRVIAKNRRDGSGGAAFHLSR